MRYPIILSPNVPSDLVLLLSGIDEFKGRWESLKHSLSRDEFSSLRRAAIIASIGSSTRIDGGNLSDSQIESLLPSIDHHYLFQSRDEEDAAGYAEALQTVFDCYDVPITENHIKQLHRILLKYSRSDAKHSGDYKTDSNCDENGRRVVGETIETASPVETPSFMQELVEWYNKEMNMRTTHPLLIIGSFIVHFLAIHPFQNDYCRLSRVMTTLILLREKYAYVPYYSLEKIIETNKESYYFSLHRAINSFKNNHDGLEGWLRFFLQSMYKQTVFLNERLEKEQLHSVMKLSSYDVKIVRVVSSMDHPKIADIVNESGINRNTVKKHLRSLVEKGVLIQHGIRKETWYEQS